MISSTKQGRAVYRLVSANKIAFGGGLLRSSTTRLASTVSADDFGPADIQLGGGVSRRASNKMSSERLRQLLHENENFRNDLAYSLAFSADESSELFQRNNFSTLSQLQQDQLRISQDQLKRSSSALPAPKKTVEKDEPLPRTLADALRESKRAIVITEAVAPFRVFDVNRAWEDLCGYTFVESKGKTLGSLLKGDETNPLAATSMIAQLLRGEEAGTTLINYTKSGRRFCNRIRCRPLVDEETNQVTHFVGVLKEVAAQEGM